MIGTFFDSPEYKAWKERVYQEHNDGKCGCTCTDSTSIPPCVPKMDVKAHEFRAYIARIRSNN